MRSPFIAALAVATMLVCLLLAGNQPAAERDRDETARHWVKLTFGLDEQVFRGVCNSLSKQDSGAEAGLLHTAILLQWAQRYRSDA